MLASPNAWTRIAREPYSRVFGRAVIRSASSHWTMTTIRSIGTSEISRFAINGVAMA